MINKIDIAVLLTVAKKNVEHTDKYVQGDFINACCTRLFGKY